MQWSEVCRRLYGRLARSDSLAATRWWRDVWPDLDSRNHANWVTRRCQLQASTNHRSCEVPRIMGYERLSSPMQVNWTETNERLSRLSGRPYDVPLEQPTSQPPSSASTVAGHSIHPAMHCTTLLALRCMSDLYGWLLTSIARHIILWQNWWIYMTDYSSPKTKRILVSRHQHSAAVTAQTLTVNNKGRNPLGALLGN